MSSSRRVDVQDSEKLLLGQMFKRGTCSQAELTALLPVSQQSVSRMVNKLEKKGLLRKVGRRQVGSRGQPSVEHALRGDYAYSLGLSLMADGVAIQLIDFTGQTVVAVTQYESEITPESVRSMVAELISSGSRDGLFDSDRIFSVGLSISGFRVGAGAVFNTPESLDAFAFKDLEELLSELIGLPVWAENDGKAAALCESMHGVGRRLDNFAYFFLATGVGGGVIQEGKLLRGLRGNAGEFVGALPIDDYPFPNLERLRKRICENGVSVDSVFQLTRDYDDGWPGIDEWIKEVLPSLSLMASATSAILDTEAIVLGGLVPKALAERIAPQIEFFDIHRRGTVREHAIVLPAEYRGDAAAMGAALLPFADKFFEF